MQLEQTTSIKVRHKIPFKSVPYLNPLLPMLGTLPALLLLVIFYVAPAALNIVISFTDYNYDWTTTAFVGLRNYIESITLFGGDLFSALWVTIKFTLLTVLPTQILAFGVALMLNSIKKYSNLFRALYFLPNILGSVVVCFAWKLIFDTEWGPLVQVAKALGINTGFLGDPSSALLCVALITIWGTFGYHMVIYLAGLAGLEKDYLEAAKIDGANWWQTLTKIVLPLVGPSVKICFWVSISGALGMVDVILLTTQGLYGTETLGYYIYRLIRMPVANTQGMSAAVLMYNFLFVSSVMLAFNAITKKFEVQI